MNVTENPRFSLHTGLSYNQGNIYNLNGISACCRVGTIVIEIIIKSFNCLLMNLEP